MNLSELTLFFFLLCLFVIMFIKLYNVGKLANKFSYMFIFMSLIASLFSFMLVQTASYTIAITTPVIAGVYIKTSSILMLIIFLITTIEVIMKLKNVTQKNIYKYNSK